MVEETWSTHSTNLLKGQMALAGISYEELIRRLAIIGVEESYKGLANKINRGTFSFSFFLQCMKAIGVSEVRL
jgi:hypothetical protein